MVSPVEVCVLIVYLSPLTQAVFTWHKSNDSVKIGEQKFIVHVIPEAAYPIVNKSIPSYTPEVALVPIFGACAPPHIQNTLVSPVNVTVNSIPKVPAYICWQPIIFIRSNRCWCPI